MRFLYLSPAVGASLLLLVSCNGGGGDDLPFQDEGELLCPSNYVTGSGNVWRANAAEELELRDLPCLEGDGTLHGYYVGSLTTSLDEIASRAGVSTYSAENTFVYELGDPRLNEVEAYYVVTHMANWVVEGLASTDGFDNAIDRMRLVEIYLDYEELDIGSRSNCNLIIQGMQGLTSTALAVDIFAHEFGHHVVFSLNRDLLNSMLHEALADYLAAAFTQSSVVEGGACSRLDRNLDNDLSAPEDVITRGEYCQNLLDILLEKGIYAEYPAVAEMLLDCLDEAPAQLAGPEQHWAGMILSGALWELSSEMGGEALNRVLFHGLRWNTPQDTGDFMQALIDADVEIHDGASEQLIRDTFAARGIDQDLGLTFSDVGYSGCP